MKKSGLADSPFFVPHLPAKTYEAETCLFASEPDSDLRDHSPSNKTIKHTSTNKAKASKYASAGAVVSIAEIIQAITQIGKEAATHRFTDVEKRAVATIIHTLQLQKIRTSENEIVRIALNFLLEDYSKHGDSSILMQVLKTKQ